MSDTIRKLHPARFPNMSPRMAALMDCILTGGTGLPGVTCEPRFRQLHRTTDGGLLGEAVGDCGANHFIGAWSDFSRNWANLLACAGLTDEEKGEAGRMLSAVLTDWSRRPTFEVI